MNDLSDNPKEDGYNIVRLFLQYHPNAEADIQSKADKYSFCSDLAEKHLDEYKEPKKLAVWNIVELFSLEILWNCTNCITKCIHHSTILII